MILCNYIIQLLAVIKTLHVHNLKSKITKRMNGESNTISPIFKKHSKLGTQSQGNNMKIKVIIKGYWFNALLEDGQVFDTAPINGRGSIREQLNSFVNDLKMLPGLLSVEYPRFPEFINAG